jgi:F-type H+-transporting ATPase subunit epsilon
MKIKLEVITPEKKFVEKDVYLVEFQSIDGQIGIMQGHKNLASIIAPGMLNIYQSESKIEESFFIADGCFTVTNETIKIMVSYAIYLNKIDKNEIDYKLDNLQKELNSDDSAINKSYIKQQIKIYEAVLEILAKNNKY